MTPYMWAMLFLAGTIAFIVLEMFIPSGGVLSFLATVSLVASVVVVYYNRNFVEGTIYLGLMSVLIPSIIVGALKYWPYTPIGRSILNVDPDGHLETVENPYSELIGKRGVAATKMLLSGSIRVEGVIYDAVSDGQAIEPDQAIVVVDVDGNRILVRADTAVAQTDGSTQEEELDPLSRPASEVVGDAFDDPLT